MRQRKLAGFYWAAIMGALISLFLLPCLAQAVPVCGNGVVEAGEQCDDSNILPGDGCSEQCLESLDMGDIQTLMYWVTAIPVDMVNSDLNGDGVKDLMIVTSNPGGLYTYLPDGNAHRTLTQMYSLEQTITMVVAANLNGDHFPDAVAFSESSSNIHVLLGNGDGTMTVMNVFHPGPSLRTVKAGDLNNDGFDDLVAAAPWDGGFYIYYSNGHGGFSGSEFIASGNGAFSSGIGNFNGDGYNDVALATLDTLHGNSSLKIYLGGPGGLTLSQTFDEAAEEPTPIDLNRDGYYDLFVTAGTIFKTYINQGNGVFVKGREEDSGQSGWRRDVGDLNNDGIPDLALATDSAAEVRVLLGDGQGWFKVQQAFATIGPTRSAAIVDFDKNGIPDIFFASQNAVRRLMNHNYYEYPVCGDSRIGRGENCDDGNTVAGDGCSAQCRREAVALGGCGDGLLQAGEECDDGNRVGGDGCNPDCTLNVDMEWNAALGMDYPQWTAQLQAVDLDHDGIDDLVVIGEETSNAWQVYTYLQGPDGGMTLAGVYPGPYTNSGTPKLAVGDFNGDGNADVFVGSNRLTYPYLCYQGNGDGTLTLASGGDFITDQNPPNNEGEYYTLQVADMNNDGIDDVIAGFVWTYTHPWQPPAPTVYQLIVFQADETTHEFPVISYINADSNLANVRMAAGDLNGDGMKDLAIYDERDQSTRIFLRAADGFHLSQTYSGPQDAIPDRGLNLTDFNGDGVLDLVGIGDHESVYYQNAGDGTFSRAALVPEDINASVYPALGSGDLNNDGLPELWAYYCVNYWDPNSHLEGGFKMYTGSQNIVPFPEQIFPLIFTQFPSYCPDVNYSTVTDVNHDGLPDILARASGQGGTPYLFYPLLNHSYYNFPVCGDGRIGRGETCDDGNTVSGDACSSTCQREVTGMQDTDHDGLIDQMELYIVHTDPYNPDTDHDCVSDGDEYAAGFDPLDPSDQAGCQAIVAPDGAWRIQVTLLEASASLTSDIYLAEPIEQRLIRNSLKHVGQAATTGVLSGETVTFFIRVNGEPMGLGVYDHYSDSAFARVTRQDAYDYTVGFEDLPVDRAD
jgi:cysteine-rich repeat protein